ncbi:MAG: response regulator transcription factor [Woeseiaceae bacterium]|nr:response regulator transcription factor [Woeseiaceae bacterium]
MEKKAHILVVEDEPAIREGLTDVLVYHGYSVDVAADGREGLAKAQSGKFDLLLLDIMLPGIDGYEICERVRAVDREQPIIMLTARSSDDDIIQGLKLGADDYVSKPFSIQQLVLRIEAVLRRSLPQPAADRELRLAQVVIDTATLSGRWRNAAGGEDVGFTRREVDILKYLAAHRDRPVSREELLVKVWGYGRNLELETRTVDIHIAKIRRKIEVDSSAPDSLRTIRGVGYQLHVPE